MRKILLFSGIVVAIATMAWYVTGPQDSLKDTTVRPQKTIEVLVSQLPDLKLLGLDGAVHFSREFTGNNVLVLYNPDCDHCQREAKEIRAQLKAFENYTVWFVSSEGFENINKFAHDYDLMGHVNVHFVRTGVVEVINNFGSIATPSLYIYSSRRQLVKAFNGETKIEEILKFL
ncbi:MAG: redoxin domain-containing protein [Bacteroidota bacterium]